MDRRSFITRGVGLLAMGGTATGAEASPAPAEHATAEHATAGVKITWFGASTLQIEFKGRTLLADPCFGEGEAGFVMGDPNEMFDLATGPSVKAHARNTPLRRSKLRAPDWVILSHAHEDHFDQSAARALAPEVPFLLPPQDVAKIAGHGFTALDPVDWGESRSLAIGRGTGTDSGSARIDITALPAAHSETPEIAEVLGKGNGYWLRFTDGDWSRSIYWSGDTFGTPPVVEAVAAMGRPDLMIAHLGGVGATGSLGKISMGAEDLMPFVAALQPKQILPIHHTTYDLFLEPIAALVALNGEGAMGLDVLASGSTLLLD